MIGLNLHIHVLIPGVMRSRLLPHVCMLSPRPHPSRFRTLSITNRLLTSAKLDIDLGRSGRSLVASRRRSTLRAESGASLSHHWPARLRLSAHSTSHRIHRTFKAQIHSDMSQFYDLKADTPSGTPYEFSDLKGKVRSHLRWL